MNYRRCLLLLRNLTKHAASPETLKQRWHPGPSSDADDDKHANKAAGACRPSQRRWRRWRQQQVWHGPIGGLEMGAYNERQNIDNPDSCDASKGDANFPFNVVDCFPPLYP